MQRLVYRRIGGHESIVAVHSVNTARAGAASAGTSSASTSERRGRALPAGHLRAGRVLSWMASTAMERKATSAIGYSFGGSGELRRTAVRGPARGRSEGQIDVTRDGARRGRGGADDHDALGGLPQTAWIRATMHLVRGDYVKKDSAESDAARIRDRLFHRGGDRASSQSGSRRRTVAGCRSS